jgi:hypothetical protein
VTSEPAGIPLAPIADPLPTSLLVGVDAAVCDLLGIRSLRHRSAALELCARPSLPSGAVAAAYDVIAANWRRCRVTRPITGSTQNWRWRDPKLDIATHNTSPEIMLERAIVGACERRGRADWANQVPIASGVASSSGERRRAIDLVRQAGPEWFELVELKVDSDTPLYAAFEIISYACIWLLSRGAPRTTPNPILDAKRIEANVLAPESYFRRFKLAPLASQLSAEISALGAVHGVTLSFAFERFKDELGRPPFTDAGLMRLLDERRPI